MPSLFRSKLTPDHAYTRSFLAGRPYLSASACIGGSYMCVLLSLYLSIKIDTQTNNSLIRSHTIMVKSKWHIFVSLSGSFSQGERFL